MEGESSSEEDNPSPSPAFADLPCESSASGPELALEPLSEPGGSSMDSHGSACCQTHHSLLKDSRSTEGEGQGLRLGLGTGMCIW